MQADWRLVIARTSETLQTRAKDLMLAAYLTEALCEGQGFAGFRDGLRVITGLLERFWDGVYPRIEGEDVDRRLAPLLWMTEAERGSRLPNRLREFPSSRRSTATGACRCRSPSRRMRSPRARARATRPTRSGGRKRKTGEDLPDAVAAAPVSVFGALRADLAECLAELARFKQVLDDRFQTNGPSVTPLREALEECSALANKIFKDKGGSRGGTQAGGRRAGRPTPRRRPGPSQVRCGAVTMPCGG